MPDPTSSADGQPDDPWLVERLLSGAADQEAPELSAFLSAVLAPGTPKELAGEVEMRAAFHAAAPVPAGARLEGSAVRPTRMSSKLAAAVAVGCVTFVGVGAAALGGALPTHERDGQHAPADDRSEASESPADEPTATVTDEPTEDVTDEATQGASQTPTGAVGPDATGSAMFGLCNAYRHGGLAETSTAYDSLVAAAGGEQGLDAFCASATHPGNAPTAHPTHPAHPSGQPAPHATDHPSEHATSHPSGPPTSHPSGHRHPTGAPSHPAAPPRGGKG